MKVIKKPIIVEAFQYGFDFMPDWFMDKVLGGDIVLVRSDEGPFYCEIKTLEGIMIAKQGDWIIKGVAGEIYPCKPDIFKATYEVVDK